METGNDRDNRRRRIPSDRDADSEEVTFSGSTPYVSRNLMHCLYFSLDTTDSGPDSIRRLRTAMSPARPRPQVGRMPRALLALLLVSTEPLAGAVHDEGPPVAVDQPIILFDGTTVKDLSHFYTWLADHAYQDPNCVFTVVDQIDGAPAIRISGRDWGGIVTRKQYRRYRLLVEFRWGNLTWGQRMNRARNSGILVHCQGPDGNRLANLRGPWIVSVEYEILEGRTGDVILVAGFRPHSEERILPRAMMRTLSGDANWNSRGEPREFVAGKGHLHWFDWDRQWKDVFGFRGSRDVEKPVGEWNRIEVFVDGPDVTNTLNGVKVLELTDASLDQGRLMFQSEGAEIYFRRIELHPLPVRTSGGSSAADPAGDRDSRRLDPAVPTARPAASRTAMPVRSVAGD